MKILWKRFLPQQLFDSWRQAGSVFALCPTPDKLHILLWKLLFGTIKVINEVFRYYDVQRSEIRVCALHVSCPKLVLCSLLVKVVKAIVSSNYPIPRTKIFAEILLISNKIRVDCRQIKEENRSFFRKRRNNEHFVLSVLVWVNQSRSGIATYYSKASVFGGDKL